MPTPYQASYDFENTIRDLSTEFNALRQKSPTLIGLIQSNAPVFHTKHEWLEHQMQAFETTIASFDTTGASTETGVNVASTAGFMVGDILEFDDAGASKTEYARIVSIDSATDLTLQREYGGTTGVTLVVGWNVRRVARPRGEGSSPIAGNNVMPSTNYNYTQIIDRTVEVYKTAEAIKHYGVSSVLNMNIEEQMYDMLRELNTTAIKGVRVQRSASVAGSAGGLRTFVDGGNEVAVGGAVAKADINTAMKYILEDGGEAGQYALLCAVNQAQRISAFNTAGTNPVMYIPQGSQSTGGYISQFVSDIPVQTGFSATVIVDQNMPKDKIYILDLNKIRLGWLRPITDENAANNGDDKFARRLLGEFTLEIKDGQTAHAVLTGLTI